MQHQCIGRSDLRIGKITIQIIFDDLDLDLDQILKNLKGSDLLDKYLRSLTDPFLSLFVALRRVVLGILRAKTLSLTPKDNFLKDISKKCSLSIKIFIIFLHQEDKFFCKNRYCDIFLKDLYLQGFWKSLIYEKWQKLAWLSQAQIMIQIMI